MKFLFWKHLTNAHHFHYVPNFIFPLALGISLTLFTSWLISKIPKLICYEIYITLLLMPIWFLLALFLQNRIVASVFSGAFNEYLEKIKNFHPVTKKLGTEYLRRILSGGYRSDMFKDNVSGLSNILERIQSDEGYTLELPYYAMLFQKSAEFGPNRLFVVWDFDSITIDQVFDNSGSIKDEYSGLFRSFKKVYENITNSRDKKRIFVFKNDDNKKTTMSHPGWSKLIEQHREWGFTEIRLFTGSLNSYLNAYTAAKMNDFALFEVKTARVKKHSWSIGQRSTTKKSCLQWSKLEVEDQKKMFNSLYENSQLQSIQ